MHVKKGQTPSYDGVTAVQIHFPLSLRERVGACGSYLLNVKDIPGLGYAAPRMTVSKGDNSLNSGL